MKRGSLLSVAVTLLMASPALAQEVHVCWVEPRPDPVDLQVRSVTVCRVGGDLVEYGSESGVPGRLLPGLGYDSTGIECWYLTTGSTNWTFLTRYGDNTADLVYTPVPGGPGIVANGVPVCTSEPTIADPPDVLAYQLIMEYVHQPPDPSLDPEPLGITGMETFVILNPPPPFTGSLVSPITGSLLEAEAAVAAVHVVWGDGGEDTYTTTLFPGLLGYPDGVARHTYEAKTCDPPGSRPRCHPELSFYPFSVSYRWVAQWRVDGGPWQLLTVPPTATSIDYQVAEIIPLLTG